MSFFGLSLEVEMRVWALVIELLNGRKSIVEVHDQILALDGRDLFNYHMDMNDRSDAVIPVF